MTVSEYFQLNTGHRLPAVGLGTWMGKPGGVSFVENKRTVATALANGYRHIDTAAVYGVEGAVGEAIKESGLPRKDIFITTKLGNADHARVPEAFESSLRNLGTDYIDLWLMHWPCAMDADMQRVDTTTPLETWLEMEKVFKTGKVRAIGVSNFSEKTLPPILEKGTVVPAVNQIELHPNLPHHQLRAFHETHGIHTMAYSSLGGQVPSGQGARGSLHTKS